MHKFSPAITLLSVMLLITLLPLAAGADKAVNIEAEYAASAKLAQERQQKVEKVFADILFKNFGKSLEVTLKPNSLLKKPVDNKIELNGATLFHQVAGIPFNLSAEASQSKKNAELESISLNCAFLYPLSDKEKKNAFYLKLLGFPRKYATWEDFLARKADKYEIRKMISGQSGEITAIEIISTHPGTSQNRLPILESEASTKTSGSLFLDGVDITGDGAQVKSNKAAQPAKKSGFLKGVGEFFRQQKEGKKQNPSGPQPGEGAVVSKKISIPGAQKQVFCPAVNLYFIQPGSPQVQIELIASFRITGNKDDVNLVKNSLSRLENFADNFFQHARKACKESSLSKSTQNEGDEKPPANVDVSQEKNIVEDADLPIEPGEKPLTQTAKRILELQEKLQKLVPGYIPDNPTLSDREIFSTLLADYTEQTSDQIAAENKEIEEAMITSSDGSGLGIVAITAPADGSVGPGENFKLKIKVLSKTSFNGSAAFYLTAYDPWTGKELGRKIAQSGSDGKTVELQLKAPPVGEATRRLDLEVVLEPLIGADAVPKKVSFILRGNISDGDILNRVREKIFSHASGLRLAGFGISEQEREEIFENWQNSNWKDPGRKAEFLKTFKNSPGEAMARLASFVQAKGSKILEGRMAQQTERINKEAQEHEKLTRLIKFYNLETSVYKRNSVIDYRMDPGYSLIDVLEDHISYDPDSGEILGDLDEARQAIVEEHWELMKKTMSAADRYALQAGDDGLPKIDNESQDKILAGLGKIKDGSDYINKALDLVKYYQQFEVLNAEQAKNLGKMLHRLAKTVNDTSYLVGDSARPLAQALREYEGFFSRAAKLNEKFKSDLKVSDVPGALGNMAETMSDFAGKINVRYNSFKTAVDGLAETGKTAAAVRNLKKAVSGLGKILSRSLELGSSLCRGLIKFADTIIESGLKGAGKAAAKGLDVGQDASDWLNGKIISAGDEVVDLGKTANDAAKGKGFVGRFLQGLKNKAAGSEKLINGIGHGIDAASLILEYNVYRNAGQSEAEALSRSGISAAIEKVAGSKYSPLGLINFGLSKTMDFASSTLGLNQAFEEKFNMKTNQVNFSTPVKIMANQTVNQVMDFYNSYVVPGQRLEKARANEDKIIALTIAAENCLKMAKNSKNQAVKDAYMKQRKIYREEIRNLGGRSQ